MVPDRRMPPRLLRHVPAIVATLAALLFAGCSSVPNVQPEASTKAKVKRIAVIEVRDPVNVQVDNLDGVGTPIMVMPPTSTGAGAGTDAQNSGTDDHSSQFAAAMKPLSPGLGSSIQAAVAQVLKADGYEVTFLKPPKGAKGRIGTPNWPLPADVDAVMQLECSVVGYMASFYAGAYEPWVVVNASLVDAKADRKIYDKTLCVGYKMKVKNAVYLPADQKYRYDSFDDLLGHVKDAYQGLVQCGLAAARQVGVDLHL